MRSRLALALLAPLALAAGAERPRSLSIAAAANLRPALEEVMAAFEAAHPDVRVRATYGASGLLHAQIRNGAPFDLFLAADAAFPARLARAGLTAGPPFPYARGRLVLWVPSGSPLDLARDGLAALRHPSVRRVAIGNPAVAPYGAAAEEALRAAGLLEALRDRLVLGQSVSQAAEFAWTGNAQAAFLPLSLAIAPPLAGAGRHLVVSAADDPRLEQAGAVLAGSRDPEAARGFASFLLGPAGREILQRRGYGPPPAR